MKLRELGNTGLKISVIGLGCAQLRSITTEYAIRLVRRAFELGVNYYDIAHAYGDSEIKLGKTLKGCNDQVYVSSKIDSKTKEEAQAEIHL